MIKIILPDPVPWVLDWKMQPHISQALHAAGGGGGRRERGRGLALGKGKKQSGVTTAKLAKRLTWEWAET